MSPSDKPYLLGINQTELDRLRFQHGVWSGVTGQFFDRLGVGPDWNCLDAGAGPGFVTFDLRERVGATGEVTALEPSDMFTEFCSAEVARQRWANVQVVRGSVENTLLPQGSFDLVFARWVLNFVPDVDRFVGALAKMLRPGGIIAIQDYYYEGLSLFPKGGAFDGMADVVRAYYRAGGGDPYATGRLPGLFGNHGITTIDFTPRQLAGHPGSPVYEWAHRFFPAHIPLMAERGIITPGEATAYADDWESHHQNPGSIFFSPIVMDVAGRRNPP